LSLRIYSLQAISLRRLPKLAVNIQIFLPALLQ
jgi:hypothetical protein